MKIVKVIITRRFSITEQVDQKLAVNAQSVSIFALHMLRQQDLSTVALQLIFHATAINKQPHALSARRALSGQKIWLAWESK
jgi:hypothetical protein